MTPQYRTKLVDSSIGDIWIYKAQAKYGWWPFWRTLGVERAAHVAATHCDSHRKWIQNRRIKHMDGCEWRPYIVLLNWRFPFVHRRRTNFLCVCGIVRLLEQLEEPL